ncbi:hypothetical protein NY2A_B823L [Paramecium bursaria Chlorella virus NY2A]|uniref:Uncharacterized protein B823L n=1 Tax=Paramecium bursaria Chlorella virus NY2A TaxID=46021 RepID=A7IXZ8_PBCVN|nr:hypothetical protein NY2A_B823L [Paramecium bursaria Chlorella virus NY2A]ABT15222.1 hypothetical protein NY2A_B823L [Paramecium bursaria Chlorella virus NY2A]
MDAFIVTKLFENKKENFTTGKSLINTIQLILSLTISTYAAFLSWNCSVGDHPFFRILFAILAFWFGILYILYYVLLKQNACKF